MEFHGSKKKEIENLAQRLQLNLSGEQVEQLALYVDLILSRTEHLSLTGEKSPEGFIGKQIFDSIYILKLMTITENSMVLDLGSGGGLPGIPLNICLPGIRMTLMDSCRKKIDFLLETINKLGLDNITVLHGRAEEWGQKSAYRESYDYVLSKAVAVMATLAELTLPFARSGGRVILFKGPAGAAEAFEAKKALDICGGTIERVWYYSLQSGEQRQLYLLKKIEKTPEKYPRHSGRPKKRPIM